MKGRAADTVAWNKSFHARMEGLVNIQHAVPLKESNASQWHTGELCSACIEHFYPSMLVGGKCDRCRNKQESIVIFAVSTASASLYILYIVRDSLRGSQKIAQKGGAMPFHTISIRIVSSFMQISSILQHLEISLPAFVRQFLDLLSAVSALSEQALSFDCIQPESRGTGLFFAKQTLAMLLPILATPLILICWYLLLVCGVKHVFDKFVATMCVTYYMLFPTLINRIAISFACVGIGDLADQRFILREAMQTECYSSAHVSHIIAVTIPSITLYIVLIPLYMMKTLVRLKRSGEIFPYKENYNPMWTRRWGFMFAGYEPEYTY